MIEGDESSQWEVIEMELFHIIRRNDYMLACTGPNEFAVFGGERRGLFSDCYLINTESFEAQQIERAKNFNFWTVHNQCFARGDGKVVGLVMDEQ